MQLCQGLKDIRKQSKKEKNNKRNIQQHKLNGVFYYQTEGSKNILKKKIYQIKLRFNFKILFLYFITKQKLKEREEIKRI